MSAYTLHFLRVALTTRFVKNLMTHTRNSSCGPKVVYSRFGKFESLCARRRRCSRGVAISSNDFRNYTRTPVLQQQPLDRYHGHRARVLIRDAVFAAGPLDMTTASPYNGSYIYRKNAFDCRGGQF